MENYFFHENYGTPEGAVSQNVLYHQPLPITRHQERFYANNYFELLPKVSTAFKMRMAIYFIYLFEIKKGPIFYSCVLWLIILKAVDTIGNYSK